MSSHAIVSLKKYRQSGGRFCSVYLSFLKVKFLGFLQMEYSVGISIRENTDDIQSIAGFYMQI